MLSLEFFYGSTSVFVLRVALAAIMIAHGWPKIKDLKKTASNFEGMGFKPGALWGTLAGLLEFFGGLAVLVGFLVHPIAGLFIIEFATIIIWKIGKGMPLVSGWEFDLLILAAFIVLFINGGGAYAVDRIFLL